MSEAHKHSTISNPIFRSETLSANDVLSGDILASILELYKPLSSIQATASDLYDRGLNVFPIPRPEEVRMWAAHNPNECDSYAKPPYLNKPFFMSRMHKCNEACLEKQARYGSKCLPQHAKFETLFEKTNIAVMLGRTSDNLFAIDCDTQIALKNIQFELNKRKLQYWSYTTHRGGNFLFRLAEGEVKNTLKDGGAHCQISDVDVLGNRQFVVLPPSLHPKGTFYQWVKDKPGEPLFNLPSDEPPPKVTLSQMEWLGIELAKKDQSKWEAPELVEGMSWTRFLSKNNRRILKSALVEGTRNTLLTKPTYDIAALINDGIVSYSEGLDLLLKVANRCGYPDRSIRQMLNSALKKSNLTSASKFFGKQPALFRHPWYKAFEFAQSWVWVGRTAQTDRIVFAACIERASLDNRDIFRCSEREISELTACTRKTARKALRRLCDADVSNSTPKVLDFVCFDEQSGAKMYRFVEFPNIPSKSTPLYPLVVCGGVHLEGLKPSSPAELDLFGRQRIAWRVWRHLCHKSEPSKSSIARSTGMHLSSVSRALDWLMQLGLVSHSNSEGMYIGEYFTDEALGEITNSLGLFGRSKKRQEYHMLERQKRVNLALAKARLVWRYRQIIFTDERSIQNGYGFRR